MTRLGRLLVLVVLAASPAAAAPPAEAPSAEPTVAKEPKLCREGEQRTGSRIRTPRRCRTIEEWQEADQARAGLPLSAQVTEGQGDSLQKQRPQ
jgi:hypothetical protein